MSKPIRTHVMVYKNGKILRMREIIKESGFLGITADEMILRLKGNHCNCGENMGEFDLLPLSDPAVQEGGKRYMICRNCGCYSHL